MDFKNGMIILGEVIFTGAIIYLFYKEEMVAAFEKRVIKKISAAVAKNRHAREIKRQQKINKKAIYMPLNETGINAQTKAA